MSFTYSDLISFKTSVRSSPAPLIADLRGILGAKLVAYIGSVKETRATREWAEGVRVPSVEVMQRLRIAYQAADLIRQCESAAVASAWFQGLNPDLGDVSAARLLRTGDLDEVGPQVLAAARNFVSA